MVADETWQQECEAARSHHLRPPKQMAQEEDSVTSFKAWPTPWIHFCHLVSTSSKLHNFLKQSHQLETKCSNT